MKQSHLHPSDLHGFALLATDATGAVTDVVEAMHANFAWIPLLSSRGLPGRTGGVTGLAYSGVRGITRLLGASLDLALPSTTSLFGPRTSTPERDTMLSVLNGVIGDHLVDTRNPLALPMTLRRRGLDLELRRQTLETHLPSKTPRVVVLIHGLCGTDSQWKRASVDYARALESDFGFTPLYLRYNSGLHISTNGRELSALLEELVREWPGPLDELLLLGHSMGGLVARSAFHYGGASQSTWTTRVKRMAFLGSPHHGAPLERGGHWFEEVLGSAPFAAPLSRLARLRSAGVTDLRHGNLLDEDWQGSDRFAHPEDRRRPVETPANVDCLAVAATTGAERGDVRDRLVGDGLVPVASALGHHADPRRQLSFVPSRCHVVYQAHHMDLMGHPEIQQHLSNWLGD